MYCSHCGKPVNEGAKFCGSCGQPAPVQEATIAVEETVVETVVETAATAADPVQEPATPSLQSKADTSLTVMAWLLVFLPILISLLQDVFNLSSAHGNFLIAYLINSIVCRYDARLMNNKGLDTRAFNRWTYLIPVYIWKRSAFLRTSQLYFWLWCVAFVISLFL